MFVEAMKRFSGTPTAYTPYPPAGDRAAWEKLPAAYTVGVLQRAEAALGRPYPPLTATLYMEYTRTGNRSGYETPYLTRRRMLNDFIMAECVEHGGRFMDAVIDGIVSVCEETSWCRRIWRPAPPGR